MAPHSGTLAWKIPWAEEPGGLQSMGSWSVGHDWATSLSLFTFMHWRRKWQPTPVFLPGMGEPGGLPSMGSHRVRHDWSDLAAAYKDTLQLIRSAKVERTSKGTGWSFVFQVYDQEEKVSLKKESGCRHPDGNKDPATPEKTRKNS